MAKNGFKVFDSDMHIMEPPDLWERYIDPQFRSQAPRGRTSENVRDLGTIFPNQDPRFAAAMARAYNDWLHDFCKADPNRLLGAGMISVYDIDDAVSETRRVAEEYGFRSVFLRSNIVNGKHG